MTSIKPNPFKRNLIAAGLALFLILSVLLIWVEQHRVVPILMYHHIDAMNKYDTHTVSPEGFEQQMAYLKKNKYQVVTMEELIDSIKHNKKLSRKSVAITFDDGFLDNYTIAFPILKKYNFPASMFIISDFTVQEDRITFDQMREMVKSKITIGSHSRTHEYLPDIFPDKQWDQIVNSKKVLEKQLGVSVKYFAYPIGGFTPEVKTMVQKAGYDAAFTTNRGKDKFNKDMFELKRVSMKDSDNFGAVRWAKFSGYYHIFRKFRKSS